MATLVALSVSFTSCDAITDALSKEVEIEAPAIDFSVGGTTAAPQQKVSGIAEVIWLDKTVDIKTKLEEELAKNSLTIDKVKTLLVTESNIELVSEITTTQNLGNIKLYINDVMIAQGVGQISSLAKNIVLSYETPYSIFSSLGQGTVQLKITSDQPKPSVQLQMKLYNKYKSKISLL